MIRYQITDGSRIDACADFVQIRPGSLTAVQSAMQVHPRVLVNDRLDIALALKAAGVHLKSNSVPPHRVRTMTPDGFVITVACHSLEDVLKAEGADYAMLSPIFNPLSKPSTQQALGLAVLREICARSPVPILALGGIDEENAHRCVEAGAAGVAGISIFGG